MPFVLGLTGSIGMGKSTAGQFFRAAGVPVFDADRAVAKLYSGLAAPLIEEAFPGTVRDGVVDRKALGMAALGDPASTRRLETIVHPLVRSMQQGFLAKAALAGASLSVLDIPLLLETGGERRCDAVVVVSAPAATQRVRVLSRDGMTEELFAAILRRQMPDVDKRRRAHFVIDTSRDLAAARRQVAALIRALAGRSTRRFGTEGFGD